MHTNSSEWMKKTVRPNENKLCVTQGALSREAALPTQPYVCLEKFFTLTQPCAARYGFSRCFTFTLQILLSALYIYLQKYRQGLSCVIVLF